MLCWHIARKIDPRSLLQLVTHIARPHPRAHDVIGARAQISATARAVLRFTHAADTAHGYVQLIRRILLCTRRGTIFGIIRASCALLRVGLSMCRPARAQPEVVDAIRWSRTRSSGR